MIFPVAVLTPPTYLPVDVDDTQAALARAVTEECERGVLWRGIVHQVRRIVLDGPLPQHIEIEPTTAITSLTRWTPTDPAVVVDATTYSVVTRDPSGTILSPVPGSAWPSPARDIGSFSLTYECGWAVDDVTNSVPASVQLMVERAVSFRAGSGLGDLKIGSLDLSVPDSYATDAIPREISSIGRAWAYRPGIFAGRP